ncbi:M56 family metallopeptidase [Nonlabens marinus]|uniref:TonB family protein n=1 Tax=Nonlabens marinus S1-08 TaxID=1454201 RepID=W8VXX5_9FLAO|nr:M56 family metallopeptidase [Nonlabens marinus]BAO56687.1 TonB family protein [Nonlabens marinus S1-08]
MMHFTHSCLLALALYGIYQIFLKGSSGFQWHRLYLLLLPLVSALLPLMVIPIEQTAVTPEFWTANFSDAAAPVLINSTNPIAADAATPFDYMSILWMVYFIGIGISLLMFFYKLARIAVYNGQGVTTYEKGCYITKVPGLPTAFSFLNRIYINDAFAEARYEQILLHEMTHVRQRHSWDLLFYESLRILFWFHPVAYLGQRDLKMIHEHIADAETIAVHGKKSYYQNLLREALDCPDFSFANPFFKSKTIKTRLTMIQKSKNQKFPFRKLLWILPVLFASLTYTACTTELEAVETKTATTVEDLPTLQGFVYGTKDYYRGVTQKERDFVDQQAQKMDVWRRMDPRPAYKDYFDTKDMLKSFDIQRKISENGSTVVVDTDNGMILTITESPNGAVHYTGNSFDEQQRMSLEEYNAYIIKLKNKTADQREIIEEIVEVEEESAKNSKSRNIALVPFAIIEEVPTYPGCSGTNLERKQCMQEKITAHVVTNFNTKIAKEVGLSGKQTISVQFKIGADGKVADIRSRAQAPELQAEAARVINLLPKVKPGVQRGKEVGVIYGLPIIFEVAEDSKNDD